LDANHGIGFMPEPELRLRLELELELELEGGGSLESVCGSHEPCESWPFSCELELPAAQVYLFTFGAEAQN